jgi:hypothetical protein
MPLLKNRLYALEYVPTQLNNIKNREEHSHL